MATNFFGLPHELKCMITKYLDVRDSLRFALVSKEMDWLRWDVYEKDKKSGAFCLSCACWYGFLDTLQYVRRAHYEDQEFRAKVNRHIDWARFVESIPYRGYGIAWDPDKEGPRTLLQLACHRRHVNVTRWLLAPEQGADVCVRDHEKNTALHHAADIDTARALLGAGARTDAQNDEDYTPMAHMVDARGRWTLNGGTGPAPFDLSCIAYLLRVVGPNINLEPSILCLALERAVFWALRVEMVLLLRFGADPNNRIGNCTILSYYCSEGLHDLHSEPLLVEGLHLLLDGGANTQDAMPFLHKMDPTGDPRCAALIKRIIEGCESVEIPNPGTGRTPLKEVLCAMESMGTTPGRARMEVVRLLLGAGASGKGLSNTHRKILRGHGIMRSEHPWVWDDWAWDDWVSDD